MARPFAKKFGLTVASAMLVAGCGGEESFPKDPTCETKSRYTIVLDQETYPFALTEGRTALEDSPQVVQGLGTLAARFVEEQHKRRDYEVYVRIDGHVRRVPDDIQDRRNERQAGQIADWASSVIKKEVEALDSSLVGRLPRDEQVYGTSINVEAGRQPKDEWANDEAIKALKTESAVLQVRIEC